MLVLFLLTVFMTLLLVSLDGQPERRAGGRMRRLRHGILGAVALPAGLALALLVLVPPAAALSELAVPAAWGASADESPVADESPAAAATTLNAERQSEQSGEKKDSQGDKAPGGEVQGDKAPGGTRKDAAESSDSEDRSDGGESAASLESAAEASLTIEPERRFPKVSIPYESRPSWVSFQKDFTGDVHRVPLTAGPFVRKSECMKALEKQAQEAVADYVNNYLGSPRASLFIRYDLDEINDRLLTEEHIHDELIEVSLGPMHQVHALLEFDPEFRAELDQSWREVQAGRRLAQTALGAFGILGLLIVVFGYFKLDTATRGYYSTRLQILATLAILALVAAGVLFYGWIPQL